MKQTVNEEDRKLLLRYLCGTLSNDARSRLESRLKDEPRLTEQLLDVQNEYKDFLERFFEEGSRSPSAVSVAALANSERRVAKNENRALKFVPKQVSWGEKRASSLVPKRVVASSRSKNSSNFNFALDSPDDRPIFSKSPASSPLIPQPILFWKSENIPIFNDDENVPKPKSALFDDLTSTLAEISPALAESEPVQIPLEVAPILAESEPVQIPSEVAPILAESESNQIPSEAAPILAESGPLEIPSEVAPIFAESESVQIPSEVAPILAGSESDQLSSEAAPVLAESESLEIPSEIAPILAESEPDQLSSEVAPILAESEPISPQTLEDQYLSILLGRQLTPKDRDEYYWEDYSEESDAPAKSPFFARLLVSPIEYIGRRVISSGQFIGKKIGNPSEQLVRREEMNRPLIRRKYGRITDSMISVVAGILIAFFVVFPALKFVEQEVVEVIVKSTVRKIGNNVPISSDQSATDLLPFISNKFLHPQYQVGEIQESSPKVESTSSPSTSPPVLIPTSVPDSTNNDFPYNININDVPESPVEDENFPQISNLPFPIEQSIELK